MSGKSKENRQEGGFPMNFSPNMCPKSKSSISAEISYKGKKPDTGKIYDKTIKALTDLELIKSDKDIVVKDIIDMKYA